MLPRMGRPLRFVAALAFAAGCSRAAPGRVEIVAAPPAGEVAPEVRDQLGRAAADRRQLLVYAGAAWCEPCQRFHQAAASGALDRDFPSLRLLEFDLDRDGERLAAAG